MELKEYILLRYKPRQRRTKQELNVKCCMQMSLFDLAPIPDDDCLLKDFKSLPKQKSKKPLPKVEKTFMEQVFAIIDEKGLDDVETYKKANIEFANGMTFLKKEDGPLHFLFPTFLASKAEFSILIPPP